MRTGEIPKDWKELVYVMLPKTGDSTDPSNWRPIAVLSAVYKIFAKILHSRIGVTLEQQQPSEQMGFRPGRSTGDALVILESVVGNALEWNLPLWVVSVDLSKAFDRIEYDALFSALARPGSQPNTVLCCNACTLANVALQMANRSSL